MKPPLTYYGGKQTLAKQIVPLIPKHNVFCEPFFGGGAIYFSKEPSEIEVINDNNGEVINFYKVLKSRYRKLAREIKSTLHSRQQHQEARVILNYPNYFDKVKRAWAVWTLANQSYASKLNGSWGYDLRENKTTKQLSNKRSNFTEEYAKRLENTEIECDDALRIIKRWDSPKTFFYCDPPYPGTNQGHYKGYTEKDFEELLKTLSKIKGKFLLSSYRSELLDKYVKQYTWCTKTIETNLSVSAKLKGARKRKVEVVIANYFY